MSSFTLYPLLFTPIYKTALWGGDRLCARYNRSATPPQCAESWEISGLTGASSIVSNGPLAGHSLASLTIEYGAMLSGTRAPHADHFPLLFKLIDAHEQLSIQVHPSEVTACLNAHALPKNEMWYVLDHARDASLLAGLRTNVTPNELEHALTDGTIETCIVRHSVTRGASISIPGGCVHAIGAGCMIYEVQQTSDTTYRLYDWNRPNPATGKPRPLHIREGLASIAWSMPSPQLIPASATPHDNIPEECIRTPFFRFSTLHVTAPVAFPSVVETFRALFVAEGHCTLSSEHGQLDLPCGTSLLIPASVSACVAPCGSTAQVLLTTL